MILINIVSLNIKILGGLPFSLKLMQYGSVGKQSTYNAGDPGWIPGSGRSVGEGIGYTLQYSWASLVAQLIKNPRAIQETWVRSLGWEDPLEKGTATHYTVHGVAKSQTQLSNFQSFTQT